MRAGILSQSRHPAQEQAFSLSSSLPPAHERLHPNARPQAPHRPNYRAEVAVANGEKGYTSDGGGGYHRDGSGGGNGGGRWEDMGSPLIGVKFGRGGAVWGGAGRKQFNLAVRQAEIRYKDGDIHACPTAPFQQFFLHFALHHKSRCLPHLLFLVL